MLSKYDSICLPHTNPQYNLLNEGEEIANILLMKKVNFETLKNFYDQLSSKLAVMNKDTELIEFIKQYSLQQEINEAINLTNSKKS